MRVFLLYTLVLFFHSVAVCQVIRLQDFSFYENGDLLTCANAGGLRNPQFSNIDLDLDGIQDLFVFDRVGNKVLCFINESSSGEISFKYAPAYESWFPEMRQWALLHDFNKDGVEDIFTQSGNGIAGINVYRGSREQDRLAFKLIPTKDVFQNALLYFIGSTETSIYHAQTDIPAIIDVDNDGDTDILAFDSAGGSVVWYDNEALQITGKIDTFICTARDRCFGKIQEASTNSTITLSKDGVVCGAGLQDPLGGGSRHSGSTITAFDEDCDGDKELLIGDISGNSIQLLKNRGSVSNAWLNFVEDFPSTDVTIQIPTFLSAFLVDVNNDGLKDVIANPIEYDGGVNHHHIWLYLNEGSLCNPKFKLASKNFLINEMPSLGSRSSATAMDVDADGLKDILISGGSLSQIDQTNENRIYYYKNVGTPTKPQFQLVDDDYLDMSTRLAFKYTFAIESGDLDGDGDFDLLLGETNGRLYFFENKAGPNKPAFFDNFIYSYKDLNVLQNSDPTIFDFDGDGLSDIILGKLNVSFDYFRNTGVQGNPNFKDVASISNFGRFFPSNAYDYRFSSIDFAHDINKNLHVFAGSYSGTIRHYVQVKNAPKIDSFILIDDIYGGIDLGDRSTVDIDDLDNDGYYDLLLGNLRGGLSIYTTDVKYKDPLGIKEQHTAKHYLNIYPNPANDLITIPNEVPMTVALYSIVGKKIMEYKIEQTHGTIEISHLPRGTYFLKSIDKNDTLYISKLVKQ